MDSQIIGMKGLLPVADLKTIKKTIFLRILEDFVLTSLMRVRGTSLSITDACVYVCAVMYVDGLIARESYGSEQK